MAARSQASGFRSRFGIRVCATVLAASVCFGAPAPFTFAPEASAAPARPDLPQVPSWRPIPTIPGLADALPVEQAADGSPTPRPYLPSEVARSFPSDFATDKWSYLYIVDPFVDVKDNHPEIMDQNLETVIQVNNAAKNDPALVEQALDDDHNDPLMNMSIAFGQNLGQHFRDAFNEDRLPKTKALLSGNLARAGGIANSSFIEKYTYDYDRPFVVAPDRIERYYREGEDDPYSTTPAYPSGHTNKVMWTGSLLSVMLPELAPQIQVRASDAGHSRLVMGVHYPLDVMGGRMMGNQAAADRWADPEFRPLIEAAAAELRAELEWRCGSTLEECVATDTPYMSNAEAVRVYTERMTYGFPQIGPAGQDIQVPARYAGLLETRFPELTEQQRNEVLARTAIDSGYPLDRTDGEANHVRINMARALAAQVTVNADGSLNIQG
ncbi:phosphatase PAP2 family protein [Corynebacterium sp. H78]|uniref:phosphatase PAP2 family protein n=1 Tax=Corynebacterium sp. H78 TaxID=3133417 RepID=UPI00309D7323